ncbi:hypothetical protein NP233_g4911 [Leucocoprinus birnbaumii]|uniref:DUF6593 domain-containing protein n=1 Tax=Leucocoprinus birnbaumii TaxID=56174 RepID=A0AAD5VV81_9AGAR|nr:hypothetical protein NP233_g4911 [Leucocoprinus birnbaumii]
MDSKITLVDSTAQNFQIVFSKNSTLNTNLVINGQVRYTILTSDRNAQKTKIIDAVTGADFVTVQRRTILSDKVTFACRNEGEKKLNDIMKNHKLDDGYTAHMMSTPLGDLYWKVHKVHRLALFSISDPAEPVGYREQLGHTFALTIRKEYEPILDYLLPTFLHLEQDLRGGEKAADVADGKVAIDRTIAGHYVNTS